MLNSERFANRPTSGVCFTDRFLIVVNSVRFLNSTEKVDQPGVAESSSLAAAIAAGHRLQLLIANQLAE